MKYVSYFLGWCVCIFGGSAYYYFFWDQFFSCYNMDLYHSAYGFTPAGMPAFNWKINLFIWLSGIAFIAFILFLVTESICKGHFFKKRKRFPLAVVAVNQLLATFLYVGIGVMSDYDVRIYYMPIFLISKVICEVFPNAVTAGNVDSWFFFITLLHGVIFSVICVWLYMLERKKKLHILEREAQFRLERSQMEENINVVSKEG